MSHKEAQDRSPRHTKKIGCLPRLTVAFASLFLSLHLLLPLFIPEHPRLFASADISPDGNRIVFGGMHGQVLIWDWRTGMFHYIRVKELSWLLRYVRFAPDSATVAVESYLRSDSEKGGLYLLHEFDGEWRTLYSEMSPEWVYITWPENFTASSGFYVQERNADRRWISLGEDETSPLSPRCYFDREFAGMMVKSPGEPVIRLPGYLNDRVVSWDYDLARELVVALTSKEILVWNSLTTDPVRLPNDESYATVHLFGTDYFVRRHFNHCTLHDLATGKEIDEIELIGSDMIVNGPQSVILAHDLYNASIVVLEEGEFRIVKTLRAEDTPMRTFSTWAQLGFSD